MKLIRHSGLPVKLENLEAYKKEWTEEFDKAKEKHGNDMLSLQKDLADLENKLLDKYNVIENIDFVKSIKATKQLIDLYQCPIMIARGLDNPNELIYVLMDRDL